ncbi:MAG: anti-sigma factor antagonist [Candidatus Improbicoccus devescovinae]|nr:MAG: anti-sigma factor antagonist [Candidatus Improbicoccus devescovinae]
MFKKKNGKVVINHEKDSLVAVLYGEIDHCSALEIRTAIDKKIDEYSPEVLTIDFSNVKFMDSSGIGLVMGRFEKMSSIGGQVKIENIPARLMRLFKLSGLQRLGYKF